MIPGVTFRPAEKVDVEKVSRLIYLTMGIEADWLFGREKGLTTLEVLDCLFLQRGNRVGYPLSHLAELDGKVAGLLLSYPGSLLSRFNLTTGWHILRKFGLISTLRLAMQQSAYGDLKEAEKDEYYISNLGVFPEYQGKGIGSLLMRFAEEQARKAGLKKCSLIVTFGHDHARRLYEKLGYKVIQAYPCSHPKVAEGSGGYHRMVKVMEPSNGSI